MPQQIGQGGTITLDGIYQEGSGQLVDPVDPRLAISDPDETTVASNLIPTRDTTGRYHYDYLVPSAAPLGIWTATWTGTINGVPVTGLDHFEVAEAGSVSFDEDVLVTAEEVAQAAEVDLSVDQLEALRGLVNEFTAELEERLNRPLLVRSFTNEPIILPPGSDSLWLRHAPVREVLAVRTSAGTYTGTWTVRPGRIQLAGGLSPLTIGPGETFYVDYRAGLDSSETRAAKSVIKERAMRMAVKMADQAIGVRDLTQEGYSAPFLEEGWTEQELENVSRLRRRVVRT